jgi:hypothetical protein
MPDRFRPGGRIILRYMNGKIASIMSNEDIGKSLAQSR